MLSLLLYACWLRLHFNTSVLLFVSSAYTYIWNTFYTYIIYLWACWVDISVGAEPRLNSRQWSEGILMNCTSICIRWGFDFNFCELTELGGWLGGVFGVLLPFFALLLIFNWIHKHETNESAVVVALQLLIVFPMFNFISLLLLLLLFTILQTAFHRDSDPISAAAYNESLNYWELRCNLWAYLFIQGLQLSSFKSLMRAAQKYEMKIAQLISIHWCNN